MTAILIIIGISLIVFNIWNSITLRSFFKNSHKQEQINDQKYWELKYNIQFLITIFTVIIAIAGYLGVNTMNDVKESITVELKPQLDSVTSQMAVVRDSVSKMETTLRNFTGILGVLEENSNAVSSSLTISKNDLTNLKTNLSEINRKNKIQAPVYVINSLEVDTELTTMDPKSTKNFSDLVTSTGDKLPTFQKPPTIIVASNGGGTFAVTHVTTTSFRISPLEYVGLESSGNPPKKISVTIIIFQNP